MSRPIQRDYPTVGAYIKAYAAWESRTIPAPGRARQREIHPSWLPYLEHFDALDSKRSQGAFCRAYGLNRSTFSSAQCRKISDRYDLLISNWIEGKAEEVSISDGNEITIQGATDIISVAKIKDDEQQQ